MKDIKIRQMRQSAIMAVRRAQGTTTGTWVYVGWDGSAIAGGSEVRLSLPYEKIVVPPMMTVEDLTLEMSLAAARIAKQMPEALANLKPPKRKRNQFDKRGLYRRR